MMMMMMIMDDDDDDDDEAQEGRDRGGAIVHGRTGGPIHV